MLDDLCIAGINPTYERAVIATLVALREMKCKLKTSGVMGLRGQQDCRLERVRFVERESHKKNAASAEMA